MVKKLLVSMVRPGSEGGQMIREAVTVVGGPDPLGPAHLYESAARDVPPALWRARVHGSHVRGNVIPSTGL